jgi:dihydropyrimidinase
LNRPYDTVIRNGTLITPEGAVHADLGIAGEHIAAIGQGLASLAGTLSLDASGKLVIPGAIDPHVHLEMPAGPVRSSDDWVTGTIAAACGGTTTVIDFVEPEPPRSAFQLRDALAARRAQADGRAVVDYGLHMTLLDAEPATVAEIPEIISAGCPSFKTYMTYSFKLTDEVLVAAMDTVGKAGGMVMVHAENDAGIAYLRQRLVAAGHVEPRYHPVSRPASMEAEAIERALALAEAAGCPVYIVHISTARGASAVAAARGRGQAAYGETCPQYLLLTEDDYRRPGFEGAKFVCSPPLRTASDNAALWGRLGAGDLQTVGTDHCPFFFEAKNSPETGGKDLGCEGGAYPPFTRIPGGMPGIESRLSLLYSFGVREGRLSLERWVDACCSDPARVFGLYPRKGALAIGSDADIVIFDPEREATITRQDGGDDAIRLHENCDYTPYEGFRVHGWPELTMLRGRVIAERGHFIGGVGGGQFLARKPARR